MISRTLALLLFLASAAQGQGLSEEDRRIIAWVKSEYGAEVVYRDVAYPFDEGASKVRGGNPRIGDVSAYLPLLKEEISKYPRSLLSTTGTRSIILGSGLSVDEQARAGIPRFSDQALMIDVGAAKDDPDYARWVFHHEFFHLIDHKDDGVVYGDPEWARLNPVGFSYGAGGRNMREPDAGARREDLPGFFDRYGTSGVEEDKAEMFAFLFMDPQYVYRRAKADRYIKAKVEAMARLLKNFCRDLEGYVSPPLTLRILSVVPVRPEFSADEEIAVEVSVETSGARDAKRPVPIELTCILSDAGGREVRKKTESARANEGRQLIAVRLGRHPVGPYRLAVSGFCGLAEDSKSADIRVVAPPPAFAAFRCAVSAEAAGAARGEFQRGDFIYFIAEFDGTNVAPATTAQVAWTVNRPVKDPVSIPPVQIAVAQGRNRAVSKASRIGPSADAGEWTVVAEVLIAGKRFEARTSFSVVDQTLTITRLFVTFRMGSDQAVQTFAPGETVWGRAQYTVTGSKDHSQHVQIAWKLARGARSYAAGKSTLYLLPGNYDAMQSITLPRRDDALDDYVLSVAIRAERQPEAVESTSFSVVRPLEWGVPDLIVGFDKEDTLSRDDFRRKESLAYVFRFRINVDNGRKVSYEIETDGPEGRVPELSVIREVATKIGPARPRVSGRIPKDAPAGRYTVTVRVRSDSDVIETRATYHVHAPAKISRLLMLEDEESDSVKSKFKPGEEFGVYIGYSLDHLRLDDEVLVTLDMYAAGGEKSLWHREWGPVEAVRGYHDLRTGSKFSERMPEGAYEVIVAVTVGSFTAEARRSFRIEVLPTVTILSPQNGSEVTERVIVVTGTIEDRRITKASIRLNGQWKALAVADGKFAEKMVLRPGRNDITVHAKNKSGEDSQTVVVNADIPAATLKVVLDWNKDASDVDLWVTDPEGVTISYRNRSSRRDRGLDVDNQGGYGPETYTNFARLSGTYTVTVKYYDDKGGGDVTARVRWTAWEATSWESNGEQRGNLDHAAGDRAEAGSAFRFTIEVP